MSNKLRKKVNDPNVDRALVDIYRRLEDLERLLSSLTRRVETLEGP